MTNTNLTRFDKNLGYNVKDFSDYGEDATLVLCLAIFLAHEYQNNLFNTYRLDVDKFAKKMGFDKTDLKRMHDNPVHLQTYNPETDPKLFGNVIENALYKMQTTPIIFKDRGTTIKDGAYVKISSMFIFKNIIFYTDNNKSGKAKYYYDIELSEEFKNHLSLFYFHINVDQNQIKQLRKNNIFFLYLYLKNNENFLTAEKRRDQKNKLIKVSYFTRFNFDYLCEILSIANSFKPAKKKYTLNQKIEKLNEICGTNYKLSFERSGGDNFAYTPRIDFSIENVNELKIYEEKREIFTNLLEKELLKIYQTAYSISFLDNSTEKLQFKEWIYNDKIFKEIKYNLLYTLQKKILGIVEYKNFDKIPFSFNFLKLD